MKLRVIVSLAAVSAATYAGCSAANETGGNGSDTTSANSSATASGVGGAGGTTGMTTGGNGSGGDAVVTVGNGGNGGVGGVEECARFTEEANAKPAAMLFVLDKTASMTGNKWSTAQLATVAAIDKDVFDTMSLGLVTFPSQDVHPPPCLCDPIEAVFGPGTCTLFIPGVSCGVSGLPQIPVSFASTNKSNDATGVRRDMYDYLVANQPLNNMDDGSPIYEALLSGYNALSIVPNVDERMLVLITDGGFSCASLSMRGGYTDLNGCEDWEFPDNVNQLITTWRTDPMNPVRTFVVGVPGSNSNGQPQGGFDTPPYSMRLALSTYAVSGAPGTVDPNCDSGLTFSPTAGDPVTPCHFDLTTGTFDANALADTIAQIRGNALGCVYPLPEPPMGESIDPNQVNVELTIDGVTEQIPRRSDPFDPCLTNACWDYDMDGNVVILGAGCDALSNATNATVEIVVGCATVLT